MYSQAVMYSSVAIWCFLLPLTFSCCSAQVIYQNPANETAEENQLANFMCITDGGTSGWTINEKFLDRYPRTDYSIDQALSPDGHLILYLNITALLKYSGATIRCFAFGDGDPAWSPNATLNIIEKKTTVGPSSVTTPSSSVTTPSNEPVATKPPDTSGVTDGNNKTIPVEVIVPLAIIVVFVTFGSIMFCLIIFFKRRKRTHSPIPRHQVVRYTPNNERRPLTYECSNTVSSSEPMHHEYDGKTEDERRPALVVNPRDTVPVQVIKYTTSAAMPTIPSDSSLDKNNAIVIGSSLVQNKPHREVIERTSDSSESPYLIVPHPSGPPEADISTAESPANAMDSVMPLFSSYAKQWKFIAEKFGFDEDLIDEIGTNNDTDEACLDECVKKWVTESHPSSEEVNSVLSQLGEDNWSRGPGEDDDYGGLSTKPTEASAGGEGDHEVVAGGSGIPKPDMKEEGERGVMCGKIRGEDAIPCGTMVGGVNYFPGTAKDQEQESCDTDVEEDEVVTENLSLGVKDIQEENRAQEKSEVVMMKTSAKGVSTFDKPPLTYKDRGEGSSVPQVQQEDRDPSSDNPMMQSSQEIATTADVTPVGKMRNPPAMCKHSHKKEERH